MPLRYLQSHHCIVPRRDYIGWAIVKEPIEESLLTKHMLWRRKIGHQHLLVGLGVRFKDKQTRVKLVTGHLDCRKLGKLKELIDILYTIKKRISNPSVR